MCKIDHNHTQGCQCPYCSNDDCNFADVWEVDGRVNGRMVLRKHDVQHGRMGNW